MHLSGQHSGNIPNFVMTSGVLFFKQNSECHVVHVYVNVENESTGKDNMSDDNGNIDDNLSEDENKRI